MAKRIRLTRTMVREYEPQKECYPKGCSIEDMAKIDAETDEVELMFEFVDSDEVTYEIIED